MGPIWPMPHSARRGGMGVTGLVARLGRGWCVHARAGRRTLDRRGAPAVAGSHTPGRGRSYLTVGPPWPMPHSARRGGMGVTKLIARPGRGWCAHARAGRRTLDRQGAPVVAGSHTSGRGRSYVTVETPRPMPHSSRRAGWMSLG